MLLDHLNIFLTAIPFSYMALFPVLNPLGCAFIILAMCRGVPEPLYNQLCRRIAINTFILLFVILFVGTYILAFFGITIPIVQIGGGSVVAYIGWRLLNQSSDTTSGSTDTFANMKKNALDFAFYPMTMPLTAGPGCMAVTLTISAHETTRQSLHTTLIGQAGAVMGILLASITIYFCYRYAEKITHRLGENGTRVIVRLSAFLNFCIGLQITWHGFETLLGKLVQ